MPLLLPPRRLPPSPSSSSLSLSLFSSPFLPVRAVPLFLPPSRRVSTLPLSLAQPRRRSKRYFRRQIPPQQRETSYPECSPLSLSLSWVTFLLSDHGLLFSSPNTTTTTAARRDTASLCPFVLAAASSKRGQTEFRDLSKLRRYIAPHPFGVLRTYSPPNGSYLAFEGLVLFHLAHHVYACIDQL